MFRFDSDDRKPLPKWWNLNLSPIPEIINISGKPIDKQIILKRELQLSEKFKRWKKDPSIANALSVLDYMCFNIEPGPYLGPVRQIIESDEVTISAKQIALQISKNFETEKVVGGNYSIKVILEKIYKNKKYLNDHSRDALVYCEQAWLYASIGNYDKAERNMQIAYYLYPNSRYILRCFSRLLLYGERKNALKVLRNSDLVKYDSWIQAAEISISNLIGVGSNFAKMASMNLSNNYLKKQDISEVSIALAMTEKFAGNIKKYKKYLKQSLIAPSENSKAQLTWLNQERPTDLEHIRGDINFENSVLSHESSVYSSIKKEKWGELSKNIVMWQREEIYSKLIAINGSHFVMSYANDNKNAIEICRNGLEFGINYEDDSVSIDNWIRNNLCVALRLSGKVEEATEEFDKIKSTDPNWENNEIFLATNGMLSFANKDKESGRERYKNSFSKLEKNKQSNFERRFRMVLFWLQEEINTGKIPAKKLKKIFENVENKMNKNKDNKILDVKWNTIKDGILNRVSLAENNQSDEVLEIEKYINKL